MATGGQLTTRPHALRQTTKEFLGLTRELEVVIGTFRLSHAGSDVTNSVVTNVRVNKPEREFVVNVHPLPHRTRGRGESIAEPSVVIH